MSFTLPQWHQMELRAYWGGGEPEVAHWLSSDPEVLEILDADQPHARAVGRAQGLVTVTVLTEHHLGDEVIEVPGALHVDVVPAELATATVVPATPRPLPPPPMPAWDEPVVVAGRDGDPDDPDEPEDPDDPDGEDDWPDTDGQYAERDLTLA